MAQETYVLVGVEKGEIGTGNKYGIVSDWAIIDGIQPETVQRTINPVTLTPFIPEDSYSTLFNFYSNPEPSTIALGFAEQKPTFMQKFFNVLYDAATSVIAVLSKPKVASIALRFTSRPINGRRAIITYCNVDAVTGIANQIAKTVNEYLAVTGTVKSWKYLGQDCDYTVQWINEDYSLINATAATVSAGAATQTGTATTKALTGTATPAAGKTIITQYWTQDSGPTIATHTAPTSLSNTVGNLVTGVYVFRMTAVDSQGVETSATTQLTVTLP